MKPWDSALFGQTEFTGRALVRVSLSSRKLHFWAEIELPKEIWYNAFMIPASLQGTLWSANVNKLDLTKDKNYIMHQVLAYGTWEQLKWLFQAYRKEEITRVFIQNPTKNYLPVSFNFVKNILLDLPAVKLDPRHYVQSFPRNLR